MEKLFKSRKRSLFVIFAVIVAICIMLFLFVSTNAGVEALEDKYEQLSSQDASISEANAQREYILNGADEREQYEYHARELGYGYPDETKVINVTPGK